MQFLFRLSKKRIIWSLIALLVVGSIVYKIVKPKDASKNVLTETVRRRDLKQTVLATGQVVSQTDLSLSFKVSGVVANVSAKEGQTVKKGQALAYLEQKDQLAALTSARGALAQAEASYRKILDGASNEEITVAQKGMEAAVTTLQNAQESLSNTQTKEATAVKSAFSALLNSTISATADPANVGSATLSITGTYSGIEPGQYKIKIYSDGYGKRFQLFGLETFDGDVKAFPVPMGNRGLYISFSGTTYNGDEWTALIPNLLASNYVTNYNVYQAALQTQNTNVDAARAAVRNAQSSLEQAQANLDLKKAKGRPAEVDSANAQILSAQGQVQAAVAAWENTIIRAPADGTITSVDVKVGELATALKEAIILQDVGNLYAEANISEANIADVKTGQSVDVTFDALGTDRHFQGQVAAVNPASTVVSGVVNYKVTASLENIEEINPVRSQSRRDVGTADSQANRTSNGVKPGMTANITILIVEKSKVLAVPARAIISNGPVERGNGKKVARVVDNSKKKTFHEVEVQTGMAADGGWVEITGGLNEGQEVVTFIKK